jgi:hypothetical protein
MEFTKREARLIRQSLEYYYSHTKHTLVFEQDILGLVGRFMDFEQCELVLPVFDADYKG